MLRKVAEGLGMRVGSRIRNRALRFLRLTPVFAEVSDHDGVLKGFLELYTSIYMQACT
jgi:hypothetical protein